IGIAMGNRGTDVARAAAALVLLQDSFAAIVTAIRAGRLITINIKQVLGYSLSLHLPIIILSFMPGIVNQPLILLPIHIVFLELVFNPISSLVFEAEPADNDLMLRPPVPLKEELLSGRTILRSLLGGVLVGSGIFIYYGWMIWHEVPTAQLRTAVFTAMVGANLGTIFIYRRRWFWVRFPPTGWLAILSAMACLTLIVTVPILSRIFGLGVIEFWRFFSILLASIVLVALVQIVPRGLSFWRSVGWP
ncbi:MAG: cation-translocating P-type ATPase, partial [Alphaproteobacteria bacterium]|nr:cation-translocating P-type ATPase [Alphaproteobacteria bacterium]